MLPASVKRRQPDFPFPPLRRTHTLTDIGCDFLPAVEGVGNVQVAFAHIMRARAGNLTKIAEWRRSASKHTGHDREGACAWYVEPRPGSEATQVAIKLRRARARFGPEQLRFNRLLQIRQVDFAQRR